MTNTEQIIQRFREKLKRYDVEKFVSPLNAVVAMEDLESFLSQSLEELERTVREEERKAVIDEVITFRSGYVYDDYSSLYQQSGKIWAEYAEKEGKFLDSLSHPKDSPVEGEEKCGEHGIENCGECESKQEERYYWDICPKCGVGHNVKFHCHSKGRGKE